MKDPSAIVANGAKVTILEKAFPYKKERNLKVSRECNRIVAGIT
jgi:hypothetical protein